jgi:tol-pal system protein YbgF
VTLFVYLVRIKADMTQKIVFLLYVFSITVFSQQASAALFDDKEARKKILALETQMIEDSETAKADINALKEKVQALKAILKGQGISDMLNQIETLNQETSQLKGDLELANHQISTMQQREKDLYVDTDERLRKLEEVANAKAQAQLQQAAVEAEAANHPDIVLLSTANDYLKNENYQEAFTAYDQFIKDFPESSKIDEAKYGLGYAQYLLKNYKSSTATLEALIKAHPDSLVIPDALMNIANAQVQLGRVNGAKKYYRRLVKQYPDSELVPTAKKRLKALSAM